MRYLIIALFVVMSVGLFAQQHSFTYLDAPLATTDNFLAPKVNPAAMGRENCGGLTFMQLYKGDKFRTPYSVFMNLGPLGYVIEKENNHLNHHTLAAGAKLKVGEAVKNMYVGYAMDWTNDQYREKTYRASWLYQPIPMVSAAAQAIYPYQTKPSYEFGAGVRPIVWHNMMNRFEVTADVDYSYSPTTDKREFTKTVYGVNTEIINGICLGASYTPANTRNGNLETVGINFSLHEKSSSTGVLSHSEKHNYYEYDYINFSDKTFRTFTSQKPKSVFYPMTFKNELVDQKQSMKLGPFVIVTGKQKTMLEVIKELEKAGNDPHVGGILLKKVPFTTSLAHRQELIDELRKFKAKGKKIAVFEENYTNANYAFAAAIADKIYLDPNGTIDLRGIALINPYFRELADTLGVDFISYQSHKYKSAFNMFTEKQMTPEEREALSSFLSDLFAEFSKMIETGRGSKLTKPVKQIIDEGPYYNPDKLVELGLVDKLVYGADLNDQLKEDFGFNKTTKLEDGNSYNYDWIDREAPKTKIAVVYASGNIVMGKSIPGKLIGSDGLSEQIKKARSNSEIKGIILRVNSGGGSGQASDIIAQEVKKCHTDKKHAKPVVVSMSGAAASGGYYISAFADKIIAEPATLTGSIGVTGMGFHAERLFKKIHVNWSTIKYGANSDMGTIARKPTAQETAMMHGFIESFYEKFVQVCADGRKMQFDDVHKIAQGRVWTGNQAKANGLIDDLGGLNKAIDELKTLAKIKGDVELVEYPDNKNNFAITMTFDPGLMQAKTVDLPVEIESLRQIVEAWQAYGNEKVLATTPLDVKQWDK